jgi:endonuclease III
MTENKKIERKKRLIEMSHALDILFPNPQTELNYSNDWEFLVAVILSAQCTDKRVNEVTKSLFKKYPTHPSYIKASQTEFENDIKSCGFFRNKAKNILGSARMIKEDFEGKIPQTMEEIMLLPGVARKTANVVLSNLYGVQEGIAVDTHVRRFAIRFDLSDYKDPVRIEKDLMNVAPRSIWAKLNHQFVLYGREICPARKHECAEHPLTKIYPKAVGIWPKSH